MFRKREVPRAKLNVPLGSRLAIARFLNVVP